MAKAAKPAGGKKSGDKPMTKSGLVAALAEKTQLSKKQAGEVLTALVDLVVAQVGSKGPGKLVIPGLARVTVTHKPAQPGGEKKINRLTGQEYITKPKAAQNVVKLRAVKALKDALN
jgi:nucleoid DNA-binding protein